MVNPINPLAASQRILLLGRPDDAPTAWSPLALPNLLLWLDATAITGASDGDPLAVWSDRSGHGNDATQATFAQRPAYRLVGGKPVARFDGADDGLLLTARIVPPQLYVAIVLRPLSDSSDAALLGTFRGAAGGYAFGVRQAAAAGSYKLKFDTPNDNPYYPDIPAFADSQFTLVEGLHDGVTKTPFINGVSGPVDACALGYGSDDYPTTLGFLEYFGGAYQRFGGDIAEVIVCGAVPDGFALASLRSYAAVKWQSGDGSGDGSGAMPTTPPRGGGN